MTQTSRRNPNLMALAITTALAGATLSGCAGGAAPRAEVSAGKAQAMLAKGKNDKALAHAEAAVLAEPRSAAYRTMLGATYMEQGRFEAAATSFGDAIELGDTSGRTALSFALAKIAAGDNPAALAVLQDNMASLSPDDLGLALALAGQADRGVAMLAQALRDGQNSPKLRQNLAYAYALQGNWRAARVMAAEDVPADQLDARISEWARVGKAEDHRARVAGLLQVPLVADAGQPEHLALNLFPAHSAMVAEAAARVPASADAAQQRTASSSGELPAVASLEAPVATPIPLPPLQQAEAEEETSLEAIDPTPSAGFVAAFNAQSDAAEAMVPALAPLPQGASFADAAQDAVRFVSNPVVQTVAQAAPEPAAPRAAAQAPRRAQQDVAPRIAGQAERQAASSTPAESSPAPMANDGDHLIQLGSYASRAQAEAGWKTLTKRYPQLSRFERVITEAEVRGKKYYRVSAGGFEKGDARDMCSTLKGKGQGCIAWADGKPLPGALKRAERMARR